MANEQITRERGERLTDKLHFWDGFVLGGCFGVVLTMLSLWARGVPVFGG